MTITQALSTASKGDLAYVALRAIEQHLEEGSHLHFAGDSDAGIYDALWEALSYAEVSSK